jgi:hypothetical protein
MYCSHTSLIFKQVLLKSTDFCEIAVKFLSSKCAMLRKLVSKREFSQKLVFKQDL